LDSAEPRLDSLSASGAARTGSRVSAAPLLELAGSYYDPRSSRPLEARLRVDGARRVLVTGDGVDFECAASELRIAAPLLGATLTALRLPSGAALETADGDAVARLRVLVGRPVPFGLIHRWEESLLAVALAGGFVVATLLACYFWLIPVGALQLSRALPGVAQQVGEGTLSLLDALLLAPTRLDENEQARLRLQFRALSAEHPGVSLRLEFRRGAGPNAFALPDGTIVLTDELVKLSDHDDQLVGVLLHEIGHVVYGHGLRRALESSAFLVLMASYYGDVDQLTAVAGSLPVSYAKSRYSRQEEEEADTMALAGLRRHGKDPGQLARIFRALEARYGPGKDEAKYFSSHPALGERAERFERESAAPRAEP
jgi:Zn-dependent protease with chaperone function